MEIPRYEPFYLSTPDELRAEIHRLGLRHIPLQTDVSNLSSPLVLPRKGISLPNRFCAQPISGHDADPGSGGPGPLTLRRYRRYAEGGFGLIWVEPVIAGAWKGPASRLRMCLHQGNRESFKNFVQALRQAAPPAILVLQITNPPLPEHLPSGRELEEAREALLQAAGYAAEAGFDGVDIQACHGSLASLLLREREPSGLYGGCFENRTRFLREVLAGVRDRYPDLLLATRLGAFDATRQGFGVHARGYRFPDPEEPRALVQLLWEEHCLDLLNVTAASPNLTGPASERALRPRRDGDLPDEHPLMTLDRQLALAEALREAAPGLPVVGSGWSWVRHFLPEVAAGAIAAGNIDLAGLGRSALACPDAPKQVRETGRIPPGSACMVCFACNDLHREGSQPVGCVIRDGGVYGAAYQQARRFAPERLAAEARRCHFCEAAPCVAASPTGVDVPGFLRCFLEGDEEGAWAIIRKADVLPELTAQLSSGWVYREGACVETALTGKPVPIGDLQYAVAWRARERGATGARLPSLFSGKRVAVVGGGPAGVAASVRLVELGIEVDLFELSPILGGTPERLIPSSRFSGAREEIEAVLAPALSAGRLRLHLGHSVEGRESLAHLRSDHDAVLLAAGFWREKPLLTPDRLACGGVFDALSFLERAKRNKLTSVPPRVAILSGGDCAMDAARVARELGARELYVVFGGARAAMHWHMPEDWFALPGVHALMHCRPLGYEAGPDGHLSGLRVLHTELGQEGILAVELAVEAMGLGVEESLRTVLAALGMEFTKDGRIEHRSPATYQTHAEGFYAAGALINGGDTVARCVAEGMAAADCIHRDLTGQESGC